MRILFYQWNAYNLYDIKETLSALGHEVVMLDKPIPHIEKDDTYTDWLADSLKKASFDIVFSINFFPVLATACHESATPYVCWNCDSPLLAMYHQAVFYPTNFIFTFDRTNVEEMHALGIKNVFHLPLAAAAKRLNTQIDKTKEVLYPVSFIGRLYEKNSYDRIAAKLPDYLAGYLECAMNAQLAVSDGNLFDLLLTDEICDRLEEITDYRQSDDSFADIRMLFATTVLGFKTASMERIRNLNALSLSGSKVHLFTDSTTDPLVGVTIHPSVDYLSQMPQIFYQSGINLNMTIPNIKSGIPLRVWDILGSQSFLLTNYQSELCEHFTPGKHFAIFESKEDLTAKVDFYLRHDTLRQKIALTGWEAIQKDHTYEQRIRQIMQIIQQ